MALLKGKDGVIRIGADNAATTAGLLHVQSWNLDLSTDTVETWSMGDEWADSLPTVKKFSGSVECYLDFEDAARPNVTDIFNFDFYPGGAETGSGYFSGRALITGTAFSAAKDGTPMVTLNFVNKGRFEEKTQI